MILARDPQAASVSVTWVLTEDRNDAGTSGVSEVTTADLIDAADPFKTAFPPRRLTVVRPGSPCSLGELSGRSRSLTRGQSGRGHGWVKEYLDRRWRSERHFLLPSRCRCTSAPEGALRCRGSRGDMTRRSMRDSAPASAFWLASPTGACGGVTRSAPPPVLNSPLRRVSGLPKLR